MTHIKKFVLLLCIFVMSCNDSNQSVQSDKDIEIKKLELQLKERELDLREKELSLKQESTGSGTSKDKITSPKSQENGLDKSDVTISYKKYNLSSCTIELPSKYKLSQLEESIDFPEWVVVIPNSTVKIEIRSLVHGRFDGDTDIRSLYNRAIAKSKLNITYKTQKNDWFVISGLDKATGNIVYWKRASGVAYVSDLYIEYSKSEESGIESFLSTISTSFVGR